MKEFADELIYKAAAGEQDAITALYSLTYSGVYKTVKAMIADEDTVLDIVQDSYIKGFQSLDQLDSPENFRAWMKRIATNKAKDYLKKKKPILFTDMAGEDGEEIDFRDDCLDHCPEEVLDRRETTRLMNEILATLSEDQRLVIGMFYYEEMSVQEIAETLGCSENTVKSRLNYGRKKVEVKVKELEKRGTKLYSLAPLPFLLWLFSMDAEAAEIPSGMVLDAVTAECVATGATASGSLAAAAVISEGAKAAVGAVAKGLAFKIVAGVLALIVIGGGAVMAMNSGVWENIWSILQTVFTETDASGETTLPAGQETTIPVTTVETVPTVTTEETNQVVPDSGVSFDSILTDIQTALAISTEDYDSNNEYYDDLYSHLGDGVVWMLVHRESGIYTVCIWSITTDLDGDGLEELCIGRGVSPSRVTPIAIYKQNGEVIYGDAINAYKDPFYDREPLELNYIGG